MSALAFPTERVSSIKVGLLGFILLIFGCNTTDPLQKVNDNRFWESIPEFSMYDIRYIIQHDDKLFIAAVDPSVSNSDAHGRAVIWETSDAVTWERIKSFHYDIGPLTFHGDTLFCLSDSLYKYHATIGWRTICKYKGFMNADPSSMGDMTFFKDKLYVMQSVFLEMLAIYRLDYDGSFEELKPLFGSSFGGAKFIKRYHKGEEELYIRPNYFCPGFYRFDGSKFIMLWDGLRKEELKGSPANSLALRNDTLFAGFKYPASIKILVDNKWQQYTDTLPSSKSAFRFRPALKTQTTAISFAGNRMFVATDPLGVLEWSKGKGWTRMSDGLALLEPGIKDVYDPVVFLEYFKGKLIAGYGTPGYAQWGGKGISVYKLY